MMKYLPFAAISGLLCILLVSCIKEPLDKCNLSVELVYDHNMSAVDLFGRQVEQVDIYVFDEQGRFLFTQTASGEALHVDRFRMQIPLDRGNYRIMAWTKSSTTPDGSPIAPSYTPIEPTPGASFTIEDVQQQLRILSRTSTSDGIFAERIEPLWHGAEQFVAFNGDKSNSRKINLIKNTNRVRFVFQRYAGEGSPILIENYDFEIIAKNGHLAHDNTSIRNQTVSYRPYFAKQLNVDAGAVEINTLRLMPGDGSQFVITHRETGKTVFDIQLTDYLLLTTMEGSGYSEQEYLDRQDEFTIVFFYTPPVDPSAKWVAGKIQINGWTVYSQSGEIGDDL